MTKKEQLIPFEIKHIDSLGQGVSHHNDQVSFIPKTLPGEKGNALVYKKSKKVQFAQKTNIQEQSSQRIEPECTHYEQCTGCAFLHTDYKNELNLKVTAAEHQLKKLGPNIPKRTYATEERFNYRNRIQLHYDRRKKRLGLINNMTNEITEVPQCKIPTRDIQLKLEELYDNQSWLELVKGQAPQGHLEIQQSDRGSQVFLNQHYAAGGFTQVNDAANRLLLTNLEKQLSLLEPKKVLDLFGGNGNLSAVGPEFESWIIDHYQETPTSTGTRNYISQNIYDKNALTRISEQIPKKIDLLILDPPRSGLKNLDQFCDFFQFPHIIYISCFYPNMIRDLGKIQNQYSIESIEFYDFFPGTYHLEVAISLSRK